MCTNAEMHGTLIIWQQMYTFISSTTNYTYWVYAVQVDLWPLMQIPQVLRRHCDCEPITAYPCTCCTFLARSFLLPMPCDALAKATFHPATSNAMENRYVGNGFGYWLCEASPITAKIDALLTIHARSSYYEGASPTMFVAQ